MIQWMKATWYYQVLAVVLGVVIFYIGFSVGERTTVQVTTEVLTQATATTSEATTPTETGLITFKGLEMTEKALPPLPTQEEWDEVLRGSGVFENRYKEDAVKFGDIAKRYHSISDDNNPYINVEVADVTGDGQPEQIVSLSGGGSYGVDTYEIVQGESIIATIDAYSVGRGASLKPNESKDGFEMVWFRDDMYPGGYCCPSAQMVTKFKYHKGEYMAVSETVELLN
ncbi:hypothetical protein K2Q16_02115 [Patescibacteria group bacterium]|nr:hypothetical protein [Patescibacteria group bacterium]